MKLVDFLGKPGSWQLAFQYRTGKNFHLEDMFGWFGETSPYYLSARQNPTVFLLHWHYWLMEEAHEFMLVIYDEDHREASKLHFRGVHDVYGWFRAENLISSSLWDITQQTAFDEFTLQNPEDAALRFQIKTPPAASDFCDEYGYFKVVSDSFPLCGSSPWSSLSPSNCEVLYSDSSQPVQFSAAKRASYIAVYAQINYHARHMSLDFRFDASGGVNFMDAFGGSAADPHNTTIMFRDLELSSKIQSASEVAIVLHDSYKPDDGWPEEPIIFDFLNSNLNLFSNPVTGLYLSVADYNQFHDLFEDGKFIFSSGSSNSFMNFVSSSYDFNQGEANCQQRAG